MVEHEENITNTKSADDEQSEKQSRPLKKTLTNDEILAQAIIFLLAGYETTSTGLTFVAYNLARNPDCQTRLVRDIDDAFQKHVNKFYFHLRKGFY
jgi:cytochrome P450